jgi:hypothetical protein
VYNSENCNMNFHSCENLTCQTKTNYVAQEPEGSSPHSQQPAICTYTEPVEYNPHTPASLPNPILPSTPWSSEWSHVINPLKPSG